MGAGPSAEGRPEDPTAGWAGHGPFRPIFCPCRGGKRAVSAAGHLAHVPNAADSTPSPLAALHSPDAWSEVRAHDRVVRYHRLGAGRPVVVLGWGAGPADVWPELVPHIAAGHRAILPDAPAPDAAFAAWLRGFLEGIGAPSVSLVAAGAYCIAALEFALRGEGVERLVVAPCGEADETGLDGGLTMASGEAVPLLVVRRGVPAADALPLIARFLGDGHRGDARR